MCVSKISNKRLFLLGANNFGEFSNKSATWVAHDIHHHCNSNWPFNWIWKIDTIPMIKIFFWQLCHKALSVRGTFLIRNININQVCPLCPADIESIEYLFKNCMIVNNVCKAADNHHWLPLNISSIGCHDLR